MSEKINLRVLTFLQKIPKWKVITYKKLWEIFWVHPRKIASIMRYNKNPEIYPCYKVVSYDWKTSWYSAYDWVTSKIKMLENDWIKIINWVIDEKYFY
jgi:alkylated DNA nucleotide flippase Atl1